MNNENSPSSMPLLKLPFSDNLMPPIVRQIVTNAPESRKVAAMVAAKLCGSNREARQLVQQGGVFANDEKVASIDVRFTAEQLKAGVKLRKGKKVYHKAVLA